MESPMRNDNIYKVPMQLPQTSVLVNCKRVRLTDGGGGWSLGDTTIIQWFQENISVVA
jgi:hypothetical protein